MRISIIVTSYNYALFLRQAIDSALAVRWPDKEVVVVDDGSTDSSRSIIQSYGARIKALFKANGGQPSAVNFAYPHTTGDLIFILDSDDMLLPEAAEVAITAWYPGVSKVQSPTIVIDGAGEFTGAIYPNNFNVNYAPEMIKQRLLRTGIYPTASTTGNMWSRQLCDRVFPLPEGELDGVDSSLIVAAPLHGDVITLSTPLAKFRVHGNNLWSQTCFRPAKLSYYCRQEVVRTEYLVAKAKELNQHLDADRLLKRNYLHLMARIASHRLSSEHAYPGDRVSRLLWYGYMALLSEPSLSALTKALLLVWFTGVAIAPRSLARYLCELRYVSVSRPSFIRAILQSIGTLQRIQLMPGVDKPRGDDRSRQAPSVSTRGAFPPRTSAPDRFT
jgi:glycosyltransferase involved in cell wall biosynthesis